MTQRQQPTPEQQQRFAIALTVALVLRDQGCTAVGWDYYAEGLDVYPGPKKIRVPGLPEEVE